MQHYGIVLQDSVYQLPPQVLERVATPGVGRWEGPKASLKGPKGKELGLVAVVTDWGGKGGDLKYPFQRRRRLCLEVDPPLENGYSRRTDSDSCTKMSSLFYKGIATIFYRNDHK